MGLCDHYFGYQYECIIELSGGVDSFYLALILKDYGLHPLMVHVDAGWSSGLAVHNKKRLVKNRTKESTVNLDLQNYYFEFSNWNFRYSLLKSIQSLLFNVTHKNVNNYS